MSIRDRLPSEMQHKLASAAGCSSEVATVHVRGTSHGGDALELPHGGRDPTKSVLDYIDEIVLFGPEEPLIDTSLNDDDMAALATKLRDAGHDTTLDDTGITMSYCPLANTLK